MSELRSIKQKLMPDALPNFRNLGVTLRIIILTNVLALINAMLQARGWLDLPLKLMQIIALITPILLASMVWLWTWQPHLGRLSYWRGVLAVNLIVVLLTLLIYYFGGEFYRPSVNDDPFFDVLRGEFISVATCILLLMYFRLRARVLSYALEDARLQVLRARIRPHFLYNTINAVLGIVRTQPKRAETALEDMADLFRMAMADERDLVPLKSEIKLCKQYVELEKLRIGDRLSVNWQLQDVPDDARIPALLLQPLLENAVYHGIEPLIEGGSIDVLLRCERGVLKITVNNPCPRQGDALPHAGNKIALQNIRERLALLFDAEASYQVAAGPDYYRVEIALPYMKEEI